MFLIIDNYDSFTYNLVQAFFELGRNPVVVKNDASSLLNLATDPTLEMVCISPGPSHPENAGLCLEFLKNLPTRVPVLGVCLGHQILGKFAGAGVGLADEVMHGKQSVIQHNGSGLFHGISDNMLVGRYHSLQVMPEALPENLETTAQTDNGIIMGLSYKDRPWAGVQFHPESVLTPDGIRLLANFPSALLATPNAAAQQNPSVTLSYNKAKQTPVQMPLIIEQLAKGQNIAPDDAFGAFTRLMEGDMPASQAGAFLLGLRAKGETTEEVTQAVNAVLGKAVPVPPIQGISIDIVGTGGDNKSSFNCSTATALTLAGMGYKVLKHGNRSVSSRSGSADVLEQLGIPLDIQPENVPKQLEKENFVFLFAPRYHPSFKHVMPVRRELGVRTLFNILGPLVNPAKPTHHLFGVADPRHLSLVAETLARKKEATGFVVHGAGGYDEATPLGKSELVFVKDGKTRKGYLEPADFGFARHSEQDLTIEGVEQGAEILRLILQGKGTPAMNDMVSINLGLAIYLLELHKHTEKIDPELGYDKVQMQAAMQKAKLAVKNGAGQRFVM